MDEFAWARYQKEAKEAETIRETLLELYPGCTLRTAYSRGFIDGVTTRSDRDLLRKFYATELDGGRLAECVTRSAERDISDWFQSNNVEVGYPRTGISHYSRSEDFNKIVAHSIRDRAQGVSSLAYKLGPLPVFAGYGITKVDK